MLAGDNAGPADFGLLLTAKLLISLVQEKIRFNFTGTVTTTDKISSLEYSTVIYCPQQTNQTIMNDEEQRDLQILLPFYMAVTRARTRLHLVMEDTIYRYLLFDFHLYSESISKIDGDEILQQLLSNEPEIFIF